MQIKHTKKNKKNSQAFYHCKNLTNPSVLSNIRSTRPKSVQFSSYQLYSYKNFYDHYYKISDMIHPYRA